MLYSHNILFRKAVLPLVCGLDTVETTLSKESSYQTTIHSYTTLGVTSFREFTWFEPFQGNEAYLCLYQEHPLQNKFPDHVQSTYKTRFIIKLSITEMNESCE